MPSERKTESVVRRQFDEYGGEVVVEEQDAESPEIAKLLKAASKSGTGPGRPDFIVTLENEPDLLVVVECKADISKHESPERSAYAEYAVDGVLHYAAHLMPGQFQIDSYICFSSCVDAHVVQAFSPPRKSVRKVFRTLSRGNDGADTPSDGVGYAP